MIAIKIGNNLTRITLILTSVIFCACLTIVSTTSGYAYAEWSASVSFSVLFWTNHTAWKYRLVWLLGQELAHFRIRHTLWIMKFYTSENDGYSSYMYVHVQRKTNLSMSIVFLQFHYTRYIYWQLTVYYIAQCSPWQFYVRYYVMLACTSL